jgi:O-antigen/teichoic acid export membrane protein
VDGRRSTEVHGVGVPAPGADSTDVLVAPGAGHAAIRGGAVRIVGYGAGVLLSLASATLVIRHLGVAQFGRYVTTLSLISISVAMLEGGVMWMAVREYTVLRGREREAVMRDLLGLRILLTAAAAVGAMTFALVAGYDRVLLIGTAVATVGTCVQALQPILSVPLQAQLRWSVLTLVDLGALVVRVALLVLLVGLGAGLVPLLAASIPAAVVSLSSTAVLARGAFPRGPTFHAARWARLLREQLPFAVTVAIGSVYFRINVVVLQLIAPGLQTGYFATSYRVIEVLVLVPVMLVAAVFPILTRSAGDDSERHGFVVGRVLEVSLIAGTLMVLCVSLGAEPIIDVIAGPRGHPSIPVLQIASVALLGAFFAQAAGFSLLSMRRYRPLLIASGSTLVVNVVLTVVLGSRDGAEGTAVAAIVAETFLALQLLFSLRRHQVGVSVSRRLLLALPVATGAAIATAALPIPPVARVAIAVPLYLGILHAAGVIPTHLLSVVRARSA